MTHVAYVRVSSLDQNTDRQLAGVGIDFDKTFTDKCSGGSTARPALERLQEYVREGDTIHVHSIDRLARNLDDLRVLVTGWMKQGITVRFHKEGLTFSHQDNNPMSELMLSMLGAVAQFERAMIRERQQEASRKPSHEVSIRGAKRALISKQY